MDADDAKDYEIDGRIPKNDKDDLIPQTIKTCTDKEEIGLEETSARIQDSLVLSLLECQGIN
ncbi:hypothetical protein KKG31_00555 [Patescibacteria group bacterium]|nr:hypothetical protein [Patescibacteria group bacterium]MBU1757677.1 hypothetical protein [Patescibacteria group bacterium]